MKAKSSVLNAVSAVALSVAWLTPAVAVIEAVSMSAAQAAVIRSIEVRGNTRVDAETIRNAINISPGQNVSSAQIDAAVKSLFDMGVFSDVKINPVGSTLVVTVSEMQLVNNVLFQGNKKLKDAQLSVVAQLKPRSSFSQAAVDADAEAIKAAYSHIGRDDATVTPQVVDLGQGRVNVVYNINEGDRTKIASINFHGNNAYSARRLAGVISTKRTNFASFIFRDDVYDADRLKADEEALRRFYFNRGYADFQVVSSNATLDPTTNQYTIDITLDEGQRYTFGDISVDSTLPEISSQSLMSKVETQKGDVYSAKTVEDSIVALTETAAGRGYAFAQVTPRGDRNFENHTISIVYTVDQGQRAYVQRIEIRGNNKTRDYVIRREFDIAEGDAFNQVLIQRAKRRLEDLGFFDSVDISTAPGSEPDQVVLIVTVVEKSTGQFSIGAGYSSGGDTPGASIQGGVSESNFLGRGQAISISAAGGKNSRDFGFSFTEPYFLGQRISAGFDINRSTRSYDYYDSETTGGTIRFGLPITDNISTQLAYNYSQEKYKYNGGCDPTGGSANRRDCDDVVSIPVRSAIDDGTWVKSSVSAGVSYNTIDDMKNPHDGIYAVGSVEVAGLGGDAQWTSFTTRASYYKTLNEENDIIGILSGGAGYIMSNSSDGKLRVFDQFESNQRMIRGFEYNGIGPYDHDTRDHLGGTTYFNASAEAQFGLPFIPEALGLKGAIFADAATLYGSKIDPKIYSDYGGGKVDGTGMEWRASAGVGLLWASPFGPLRVDYAIPIKKNKHDNVQEFNFGMSTRF